MPVKSSMRMPMILADRARQIGSVSSFAQHGNAGGAGTCQIGTVTHVVPPPFLANIGTTLEGCVWLTEPNHRLALADNIRHVMEAQPLPSPLPLHSSLMCRSIIQLNL